MWTDVATLLMWVAVVPIAAGLFVCAGVDGHELLDVWRGRGQPEAPIPIPATAFRPFISIHLPIRAEPPAVVARTLGALAALDYEPIEILVVSNNTPDPAFWRPVQDLCSRLGPRFRFFDIPSLSGYKAGALNFALQQTDEAAEVVCSLDSDYEVTPEYLERLACGFADPGVTFIQCPQDYRDWQDDAFLRICYWEYWQFFEIGMVLRARRNAAMLHGTMSLIRKSSLVAAGGWSEWCVTEDSECGIRLLAAGGCGLYTKRTYGRGLIPFTIGDYLAQRRRWVIGGAQQAVRHLGTLVGPSGLSPLQRYLIARSWAPWMRDALVVAALPVVTGSAVWVMVFGRPSPCGLAMGWALGAVLAGHVLRQWTVCRLLLKLSWRDTAGATCAVVGLTLTIGRAWWRGILRGPVHYVRTPKEARASPKTVRDAWAETAIAASMAALACTLYAIAGSLAIAEIISSVQCCVFLLPTSALAMVSRRATAARSDRPGAA